MQITDAREFYPYLKYGKIYMNHAAISPLSIPVVDAINKFVYQRSVTEIENYFPFMKIVSDTKTKMGELINCDPERTAFVENTSNGLNILAQGLTWEKGDRIILNDIEFPSNIYPFLNLQSQGVEIDFAKSENGICDLEQIEKLVTPKTKLISISYVQFLSGYKADLEKIGEFCKSKNIIFCVDAIQGLGALRLDVQKCKIDFLATGCQKWLMSLQGLGFIFITKELQEKLNPKFVGWTSVKDAWNLLDYNLELRDDAMRFQNGTVSAIGIAAFNASINFFLKFGYDEIEKSILSNTKYFYGKLSEAGIEPYLNLKNVDEKNLSGIVSIKSEKAEEIFNKLKGKNIVGAVRGNVVRFAPHFYNTKDEIDKVVEELKEIAE